MSRKMLLAALIVGASTSAIGQVVMPGGAKPVAKPVMPVMVVPVTPVTPPVRIMLDISQVLSGCDITPFGS
jgi:hypothetical protein